MPDAHKSDATGADARPASKDGGADLDASTANEVGKIAGGGINCSVAVGSPGSPVGGGLALLGLAAFVLARRRRSSR